ncbi:hypothetical protein H4582DRAFT_2005966 [Lactarius indigo]|nr:hypothetical protein H4582DRAFT_2005966 [Lactarius indigo]
MPSGFGLALAMKVWWYTCRLYIVLLHCWVIISCQPPYNRYLQGYLRLFRPLSPVTLNFGLHILLRTVRSIPPAAIQQPEGQ